ncbi:hypothetical protein J3R30DRAFT_3531592 [Lentinula aciculospora]|uniref:Uncharacterized protein n=1 Tax=Lentinula aciculospora TaxID=153920 RepID=A0A9W9A113_9AGAR|nr:hypothetical protein J3R30DRAFT_3531592 [Lentinula aciculospora]
MYSISIRNSSIISRSSVMTVRSSNHAFFSLPSELHTHIFMLACSPVPTEGCTTASHFIASFTGKSLSLVSKYFSAASAPTRHRAAVLYGWREIYAFDRTLSEPSTVAGTRVRTHYLTLIADDLPQDSASLSAFQKARAEKLLLDAVKSIPLAYLSQTAPLSFPRLETMFFVSSSSPLVSSATIGSIAPRLHCPRLKELTLVCNDSPFKIENFLPGHGLVETVQPENGGIQNIIENIALTRDSTSKRTPCDNDLNQFPSLTRLTILASKPVQALSVLNADEATWDVGCAFNIVSDNMKNTTWCPRNLCTIVMKPRKCWNEKWESLRDIAKRQETKMDPHGTGNQGERTFCTKLHVFVLKPGERIVEQDR